MKKLLALLTFTLITSGIATAQTNNNVTQRCATDDYNRWLTTQHPQNAVAAAQLEHEIEQKLKQIDMSKLARTTSLEDTLYYVPIVFHIVHNYGSENWSDQIVHDQLNSINSYWLKQNPDTVDVIAPYKGYIPGTSKRYIGKHNVMFKLATIDPAGNPTRGITHTRSNLATLGGEEGKIGQWPPNMYMNIWIIQNWGGTHIADRDGLYAYSQFPSSAGTDPYGDGVIGKASLITSKGSTYGGTLAHELGHSMNLYHPWNSSGAGAGVSCGDDNVDDTPPTLGHNFTGCSSVALYDTDCNYFAVPMEKTAIASPIHSNPADTTTNQGINFSVRTRITIASILIYPGIDTGTSFRPKAFQIDLKRNGTTINTFVDTIRTAAENDTVRFVPLNFEVLPGTGYSLSFSKNPKMHYDHSGGFYTTSIPGAINITSDSTGGRYNYLYNMIVKYGYFKIYGNDSLIDYPDTVNAQNIMDYTDCDRMFTYGQSMRVRAAVTSPVGNRINLISPTNLAATGALLPLPNIPPVADFNPAKFFICAGGTTAASATTFTNFSWNDTTITSSWSFTNSPTFLSGSTASSMSPAVNFATPGWVTATLVASSNAGSNTLAQTNSIYVTDGVPVAAPVSYYFQDFNNDDTAKWPVFNYFSNSDHRWAIVNNVGYLDNTSMKFSNFDIRTPYASFSNATSSPDGVYSDFYSQAFDLSTFGTGNCNLTFYTAGAYRTTNTAFMNDSLGISYSTDCGNTWTWSGGSKGFYNIARNQLANNGYRATQFTPASSNDWLAHNISIPTVARTSKVFFRFRYKAGTDNGGVSGYSFGTGNDFYLDRINITANALGINTAGIEQHGMLVVPNPTSGSATVVVKGGDNSLAHIRILDITGKLIFQTDTHLANAVNQVVIPAESIAVKGMYMVEVITNGKALTQKLVVY